VIETVYSVDLIKGIVKVVEILSLFIVVCSIVGIECENLSGRMINIDAFERARLLTFLLILKDSNMSWKA